MSKSKFNKVDCLHLRERSFNAAILGENRQAPLCRTVDLSPALAWLIKLARPRLDTPPETAPPNPQKTHFPVPFRDGSWNDMRKADKIPGGGLSWIYGILPQGFYSTRKWPGALWGFQ